MDEEIQRKEEELNHLKDTISHLSFDISKINKNKQNKDDELKEINDDLFRL